MFYVAHLGPQRDDRGNVVVMSKELVWETHETEKKKSRRQSPQGGPHTTKKVGLLASTYRGYNRSYPFIRLFIGAITPFIIGRGPPCRGH